MKRIILLCAILFVCVGLFAQTITLEQARALALLNSRTLAQSNNALRNLALDEQSQFYSRLPSLSASYSASGSLMDRNWNFENPLDTLSGSISLSLSYDLLHEVKNNITKSLNSITSETERKTAIEAYYTALNEIDNAYYTALESAANLEAAESSLQSATLSLSMAEIRQAGGMISQGDYLRALADKESRENSRNQSRRTHALNMTKLNALMGITGTVELEPVDFSAYEAVIQRLAGISDEQAAVLYNDFLRVVTGSNPGLAKSALSAQRAELNLSNIKNDYIPSFNVSFGMTLLSFQTYDSSQGGVTTSKGVSGPSTSGISFSIRGSIPIDFWNLTNRIEKSTIAKENAAMSYVSAVSSLETNLQSALLSLYAQAESVLSSRRSLEYTERSFEYEMERYRLSQASVKDFGDATSTLITSRNSLTRASYGFLQSLATLRSLGAFDDEESLLSVLMGN